MLSDSNTKAADAKLLSHHVHQGFNMFRHSPSFLIHLPQPDLLHTMQIGMLNPLYKWNFHFMKMHKQLNKSNRNWLSAPASHDLTPENRSYEEVSQRIGKEMKEMSRYLLGVATQSPRGGSSAQHPIVTRAM
jgi:hypothetical protein